MPRTLLKTLACLLFAMPLLAATPQVQFDNPLLRQRADPQAMLHTDGQYYFMATSAEWDRIELRRTRDLNALATAEAKVLWREHGAGPMSAHIWAPEIHFIDGKWYIYFTASRKDAIWEVRPYVLENASADPFKGEWKELGRLETGWDSFSLDGTTFKHKGKRYFVWTQRGRTPEEGRGTNIYIAQMDSPKSITGKVTMLTRPEYEWEKRKYDVNEGPAVLIRNGKVFMTFSASAIDANYCMGLLTASADADLLDPASWKKSLEPVFKSPVSQTVNTVPATTASRPRATAKPICSCITRASTATSWARNSPTRTAIRARRCCAGKAMARRTSANPKRISAKWRPSRCIAIRSSTAPRIRSSSTRARTAAGTCSTPIAAPTRRRPREWSGYMARASASPNRSTLALRGNTSVRRTSNCRPSSAAPTPRTGRPTWCAMTWALFHMFLTAVPGIFEDWNHPRHIVHLTSKDLRKWRDARPVKLATDRAIDASVIRLPSGGWRLFYNNETDNKAIWYADSPDLENWTDRGKLITDQAGEGPKAFQWRGKWWLITDVWNGLAVYRSDDGLEWKRQPGNLLETPGKGVDDAVKGAHADVLVSGDRAWLFYFTHPGRKDTKADTYETRRSSIQVVELKQEGDSLKADRDSPTRVALRAR